MPAKYNDIAFTGSVASEQEHYYRRTQRAPLPPEMDHDELTAEEMEFIQTRDSFYLATISETGWPYIQHRGGPAGFLHVVSPSQLAFADYKGNRQMISTGNLAVNDRTALFLMDYPNQFRLKIMGHARVEDARGNPGLIEAFADPAKQRLVERVFFIDIAGFSWNCSQHITPRYTEEEVQKRLEPLQRRIAELEKQVGGM